MHVGKGREGGVGGGEESWRTRRKSDWAEGERVRVRKAAGEW